MAAEGILIDSGTNEVEVLEFVINDQSFGVNVLKIQAIEQYDNDRVTHVQLSHPSIVGTLMFRDNCITLVDLKREMDACQDPDQAAPGPRETESLQNRFTLVMEFNGQLTAFLVDGVDRIHRVNWEAISPLSSFLNTPDSKFTGSLLIGEREILIVDMEKILTEVLPQGQLNGSAAVETSTTLADARAARSIFVAEDSAGIRLRVEAELTRSHYTSHRSFANGQECLDELARISRRAQREGAPLSDYVDLLISDIEMPAMDGLALCRAIKSDPFLQGLPVIMFSSLINEQIARKCDDVGADAYVTKPQFGELLELLDHFAVWQTPQPA